MMRWVGLIVAATLALAVGLTVGPSHIGIADVFGALLGRGDDATIAIVRQLRAPRALLAFGVGGSLAVTGAALQALIRNPLADPYLLGLSGGAGLGATLAIAFRVGGVWSVPLAAFVGALLAIWLVYRLAVVANGVLDTRIMLLAGVVVSAFTGALLGAVVSLAPAAELRNAMLWLLGGFDAASWLALAVFSGYAAVPLAVLFGASRQLDLLSLGEEPALFLGVEVERLKRILYVAASLLTAAAVAVSGVIGFVGLVIPHGIRMVWGHRHLVLLPAAFLLGGVLLAVADALARTVFAPAELPVGVVTALVGVPVFAVLLRRWAQ
jgi:ABC-type Fe3+-siderophore transport system permease subunit